MGVASYNATALGGVPDGVKGVLQHERSNGHTVLNKSFGLLSLKEVAHAPLQHWAGVYAFAAGFRRPLLCGS